MVLKPRTSAGVNFTLQKLLDRVGPAEDRLFTPKIQHPPFCGVRGL